VGDVLTFGVGDLTFGFDKLTKLDEILSVPCQHVTEAKD
jgi:hypothetical protein